MFRMDTRVEQRSHFRAKKYRNIRNISPSMYKPLQI